MTELVSAAVRDRPIDVVLLAGMHRSGTSALTGTLHRLGITAAGSLLAPHSNNPRGFYESIEVVTFHDAYLAALSSDWADDEPIAAELIETKEGKRWVAELEALIRQNLLATGPIFSVKDPRLCRIIPLWRAALGQLGITPRAVVPLRHPRAVAASLSSRDGMQESRALQLWLTHVLQAEHDTRDLVRGFVVYDDLLDDWRTTIGRLVDQISIREQVDFDGAGEAIDAFLTDELRHHARNCSVATASSSPLVDRCWNALQSLLVDPHDIAAMHALDGIRREFSGARDAASFNGLPSVRAVEDLYRRLADGQRALEVERAEIVALRGRLDDTLAAYDKLSEQITFLHRILAETRRPFWRLTWLVSRTRRWAAGQR